MIRYLYLVKHKTDNVFKIGIASSISRFKQLSKDYNIDWDRSLYFEGANNDITKLEKILHRSFYKFNTTKVGTGGTEWFADSCLTNTVDVILTIVSSGNMDINLNPQNILFKPYNTKRKFKQIGQVLQQPYRVYDEDVIIIDNLNKWSKLKKDMLNKILTFLVIHKSTTIDTIVDTFKFNKSELDDMICGSMATVLSSNENGCDYTNLFYIDVCGQISSQYNINNIIGLQYHIKHKSNKEFILNALLSKHNKILVGSWLFNYLNVKPNYRGIKSYTYSIAPDDLKWNNIYDRSVIYYI